MKIKVTDVEATGTPSGTTYLRGDGSWETPAGGGGGGGAGLQVLETMRKLMPAENGAPQTVGLVLTDTGLNSNSGPTAQTSYFASKTRARRRNTTRGVNQHANYRTAGVFMARGTSNNAGGFKIRMRGGMEASLGGAPALAENRYFQGITTASSFAGDPSSLLRCIGMGCDQADTNMQIMHNDNAGTCTKVSLGSNFPAKTSGVDVYRLELECDPVGTEVRWKVVRENTGHQASGTITTDLPEPGIEMRFLAGITTGSTNGDAVEVTVFSWIMWEPEIQF